MGIEIRIKTKAKAGLRLYNQINSYLFEQEFNELRDNPKVRMALIEAKQKLAELINNS